MTTDTIMQKQEAGTEANVERASDRPLYSPRSDIYETDDRFVLLADMPGVDRDSIDIVVEKKILTIHGRIAAEKYEQYALRHSEYGIGDYYRTFSLTDEIDEENIEADLKNGVLKLMLPKIKPVTRKIAVKGG